MTESNNHRSSRVSDTCTRRRLAESGLVAVDVCDCGMMQLHVGALSLRITPESATELLATLGQAVAAYVDPAENLRDRAVFFSNERGKA